MQEMRVPLESQGCVVIRVVPKNPSETDYKQKIKLTSLVSSCKLSERQKMNRITGEKVR